MVTRSYIKYPDPIQAHLPSYVWEMPVLCAALRVPKLKLSRPPRIAIGELGGGYRPDEVKAAFAKWGLAEPNIEIIRGSNRPGSAADGEVKLDIDVAAAAAAYAGDRSATIGMAFGGNTDQEFLACQQAMNSWGADAQSWSWGGPEAAWSLQTIQQHLALHRAAGVPICVAAGDSGSSDGMSGINADFPASSPAVIACNGTLFFPGQAPQVWNDGPGSATGGCYSRVFQPSPQIQVGLAQYPGWAACCVAGPASPRTGYNILLNGGWGPIGGTSAVAPFYAGVFAAFVAAGVPKGILLDRLWRHQAAFLDVRIGDNGKFPAVPGPDVCTGLGHAIFDELFKQLTVTPPAPVPPGPTPIPPTPTPGPGPTPTNPVIRLDGYDANNHKVATYAQIS